MLRSIIDSEKLIEEVKKRPVLYDGRAHGNNDANVRKACWEEITKDVFHEVWDTSSNNEKEALEDFEKGILLRRFLVKLAVDISKQRKEILVYEKVFYKIKMRSQTRLSAIMTNHTKKCKNGFLIFFISVKEVQVKWKSLRDAYNRVRKQEKEDQMKGIVKNRKKYVFYDQLSFLETINKRAYSPNAIFLQEERNDDSLDNTYFSSENSNLFKSDQDMFEANTSTVVKPAEDVEHRETDDRLCSVLRELVKIQKEDRADDRMGNKKFLLSLMPFMEKLPDDVNLEVRLQLMSIIQTYSNGESFMKA